MDSPITFVPGNIDGTLNVQPTVPVGIVKVHNTKRFMIVAAILFAIALSFIVVIHLPRNPDVLYQTPLSDQQKASIRYHFTSKYTSYPDKIVRWSYVDPYYGTINDCIVFVIHPFGEASGEPWHQVIAGYTFEWDSPIDLFVYCDSDGLHRGKLCPLQTAYIMGLLTEKQIGEIHKKHIEYRANFPQMLEEWTKSNKES